jgi:hypothetical protein
MFARGPPLAPTLLTYTCGSVRQATVPFMAIRTLETQISMCVCVCVCVCVCTHAEHRYLCVVAFIQDEAGSIRSGKACPDDGRKVCELASGE